MGKRTPISRSSGNPSPVIGSEPAGTRDSADGSDSVEHNRNAHRFHEAFGVNLADYQDNRVLGFDFQKFDEWLQPGAVPRAKFVFDRYGRDGFVILATVSGFSQESIERMLYRLNNE